MKQISNRDVIYSIVAIVNCTLLHVWKLLREWALGLHHKKKKSVTVCGDGC